MIKRIYTPFNKETLKGLRAGQEVLINGVIFTARDAAHKRFEGILKKNGRLPMDLKGAVIYYAGPTPARPGKAIGSCGPTTSSRMDSFTPMLLKKGLSGMIGKGARSAEVKRAIKRYGAAYFIAIGGIGALLARKVVSAKVISFKDLGPEAVYKLEVRDFPVIVAIDPKGRDIYGKR